MQGPRLDLARAVEEHGVHRSARLDADHVAGQDHLGPEAGHLRDRAMGEVGPGQPLGEAEVVLDRRALAGLATGSLALDDDGRRPSDAAYTAAASPAGPPPTMQTS